MLISWYEFTNLSTKMREADMSFVAVKSKYQVTIPTKIRKGIDLREGYIVEATLVSVRSNACLY